MPLYQRLAQCLEGYHFQVAERALNFWYNEVLNQTVVESRPHREVILPIMFRALYRNRDPATGHWQESIRNGAIQVLQRYENVDPELFQECVNSYQPPTDDGGSGTMKK